MQESTPKQEEVVTSEPEAYYPLKFQFNAKGGDFSTKEKLPNDEFLGDGAILCAYKNNKDGTPFATFTLLTPGPLKDPYTLFLLWLNMGAWVVRLSKESLTKLPEQLAQRAEGYCHFIKQVITAATTPQQPTTTEVSDGSKQHDNTNRKSTSKPSAKRIQPGKATKKTNKSNGGKGTRK